ncbi:g5259 [Coccomyxa elongata]
MLANHFAGLSTRGKVMAEYIWLGGSGSDLRSATKVLSFKPSSPADVPLWTSDGTATGQEDGPCSVVYLKARSIHPDPLRGGDHILVLCDTFQAPSVEADVGSPELHPHPTNNRAPCDRVMRTAAASQPVFSCNQQFTLLNPQTCWPIGWPERATGAASSSQSYCGTGTGVAVGREFAEAHMRSCLHAGLRISGSRPDSIPGQWSYTVGPCRGIELGDHLWLSRYLLLRLSEQFKVIASTDPKPVPGDWSGNGAAIKYSTRETREEGKGWFVIQEHLKRLQQTHMQHMVAYGVGNAKRWGGPGCKAQPSSSVLDFTVGMENRSASVRIPHSVLLQKRGWYEDRRPASNMDPYLVTMLLVCTTLQLPLPMGEAHLAAPCASGTGNSGSASETISRGSSSILDEIDDLDGFAPDTPPQVYGLLAAECSSENEPHTDESHMCH